MSILVFILFLFFLPAILELIAMALAVFGLAVYALFLLFVRSFSFVIRQLKAFLSLSFTLRKPLS